MFLTLISFSWHDLNKVRLLENGHIYCFGMYPAILGKGCRDPDVLSPVVGCFLFCFKKKKFYCLILPNPTHNYYKESIF